MQSGVQLLWKVKRHSRHPAESLGVPRVGISIPMYPDQQAGWAVPGALHLDHFMQPFSHAIFRQGSGCPLLMSLIGSFTHLLDSIRVHLVHCRSFNETCAGQDEALARYTQQ